MNVPTSESTIQTELARVAFRAPSFWRNNPELWFIQIESSFRISGITSDQTKFHSVVAALDCEVLTIVSDILKNPPTENLYDTLKARIIKHFAETETVRLRLLFQELSLGDKKPSHLLNEMQNLASGQMTDEGIKALWLQRLPIEMQQILSVSSESLSGLSQIADKISEVSGSSPICSVSSSCSQTCQTTIQELKSQITELSNKIDKFTQERGRANCRRRSVSFPRHRSPSKNDKRICYYHRRFKTNARKCNPPCIFQEN